MAEGRIRAERRAGQLLAEMEKARGQRLAGREAGGAYRRSAGTTAEEPRTLAQIGLSKQQSSDRQKLARGRDAQANRLGRPSAF
jgi:hypothetical protein